MGCERRLTSLKGETKVTLPRLPPFVAIGGPDGPRALPSPFTKEPPMEPTQVDKDIAATIESQFADGNSLPKIAAALRELSEPRPTFVGTRIPLDERRAASFAYDERHARAQEIVRRARVSALRAACGAVEDTARSGHTSVIVTAWGTSAGNETAREGTTGVARLHGGDAWRAAFDALLIAAAPDVVASAYDRAMGIIHDVVELSPPLVALHRRLARSAYDEFVASGAYPGVDEGFDESADARRTAGREAFVEGERRRQAKIAYDAWVASARSFRTQIEQYDDERKGPEGARWFAVVEALRADRAKSDEAFAASRRRRMNAGAPAEIEVARVKAPSEDESILQDIRRVINEVRPHDPKLALLFASALTDTLEIGGRDEAFFRIGGLLARALPDRDPKAIEAVFPRGEALHLAERIKRTKVEWKVWTGTKSPEELAEMHRSTSYAEVIAANALSKEESAELQKALRRGTPTPFEPEIVEPVDPTRGAIPAPDARAYFDRFAELFEELRQTADAHRDFFLTETLKLATLEHSPLSVLLKMLSQRMAVPESRSYTASETD